MLTCEQLFLNFLQLNKFKLTPNEYNKPILLAKFLESIEFNSAFPCLIESTFCVCTSNRAQENVRINNLNLERVKRILVTGSRSFRDKDTLELILKPALESNSFLVTGGASGPDKFAENFWRVNQAGFQIFLADWERYGKQAGMLRNNEMIKSGIDQVYAFWDGQSKGTKNSIDLGKSYGAEVIIHEFSN